MKTKRKICYVSGTRADFGLMKSTLLTIADDPMFYLSIVVTGMHLSSQFGNTVNEISQAGLTISHRVPVDIENSTGTGMVKNLASTLTGCVDAFNELQPDIVLVLGDRGEMLAATIAAIHLNIAVAHIHGGERSGTVDEPVRHAISKLSHFHFVSSEDARTRLVKMGELDEHIFISGAPGLDGLKELASIDKNILCQTFELNPNKPIALMVYHPVLQEVSFAEQQTRSILEECITCEMQVIALMPNSDAGSHGVKKVLDEYNKHPNIKIKTHLPRIEFISWMATCDLIIGNSSSGIIEAGTFGTPVINVGTRQNLRERNPNVIDVPLHPEKIRLAIRKILQKGKFKSCNLYGNGCASKIIVHKLSTLDLSSSIFFKANTY